MMGDGDGFACYASAKDLDVKSRIPLMITHRLDRSSHSVLRYFQHVRTSIDQVGEWELGGVQVNIRLLPHCDLPSSIER